MEAFPSPWRAREILQYRKTPLLMRQSPLNQPPTSVTNLESSGDSDRLPMFDLNLNKLIL